MQRSKMTAGITVLTGTLLTGAMSTAQAPDEPSALLAAERSVPVITGGQVCPVEEFHPERLLVRFRPGVNRSSREAAHNTAGARRVIRDYHIVPGLQLVDVAKERRSDALKTYQKHPDVLYAEPDYIVYPTGIPNDPDFGLLWGLHNTGQTVAEDDTGTPGADIRAPEAWEFWTGNPDFTVGVIDTGINFDHPDLQDNIWTNPDEISGNGLDDDGNGYVDDVHGYDFYNDNGHAWDNHMHGTHVAGTIGAVANNNEGVAGVAWQCKLVSLKFMERQG